METLAQVLLKEGPQLLRADNALRDPAGRKISTPSSITPRKNLTSDCVSSFLSIMARYLILKDSIILI